MPGIELLFLVVLGVVIAIIALGISSAPRKRLSGYSLPIVDIHQAETQPLDITYEGVTQPIWPINAPEEDFETQPFEVAGVAENGQDTQPVAAI